jgi:hypothetical protein
MSAHVTLGVAPKKELIWVRVPSLLFQRAHGSASRCAFSRKQTHPNEKTEGSLLDL